MASQIRFCAMSWNGEVAQPGVLPIAVLDPGVAAVSQFQIGQLVGGSAGGGVGEETGDPHPVVVGDA